MIIGIEQRPGAQVVILIQPAARQAIIEYIGCYNTERRHSALDNIAPAQLEQRWRAGIEGNNKRSHPRHRVTHRRLVSGSSQATEPAVRG
jgi:hypothetical protein